MKQNGFLLNGYWMKFEPGHFEPDYCGGWRWVYDDDPPVQVSYSTTTNVPGKQTVSNSLNGL